MNRPEISNAQTTTSSSQAFPKAPIRSGNPVTLTRQAQPRLDYTLYPKVSEPSTILTRVASLRAEVSTANSLSKIHKEADLFSFLQEAAGMCILHVLIGEKASHKLFCCPMYSTFSSSYLPFRSKIRFSKTGICYRCAVPTSDRFEHPNRSKTDDVACKFDDILKPLAFAIFSIPCLRDVVLPEAGVHPREFPSFEDYACWLGVIRPGPQSLFNLWEVCHAYIHLTNNKRFALP
ncbi:hypothetical protein JVT61DRAFT_9141 [Boletus reticuloceps]|uniref:Uncharacterized protein n=1 Tax=Boletus reticuloceps TaxID=495285 RepID=A0A8I2YGS6_9AGAM|nr:hypothetical protein JVT61DRAFT_9463 [Boletus reticuloceps]KAG6371786.1 hypothetical protein JVT61DRAFT_9141 [Boletus reticuloceps]